MLPVQSYRKRKLRPSHRRRLRYTYLRTDPIRPVPPLCQGNTQTLAGPGGCKRAQTEKLKFLFSHINRRERLNAKSAQLNVHLDRHFGARQLLFPGIA